jgi:hypothetical protein
VTGNETFAAAASDLELLPDSPPSLTNDQF